MNPCRCGRMSAGYPEGVSFDAAGRCVVVTPAGWCDYPLLNESTGTLLWDAPERIPAALKQAAWLIITERNRYRAASGEEQRCR
jgi:hypothetical protein